MIQHPKNINNQLNEKLPIGWPWKLFLINLSVFIVLILVYVGLAFGYRSFLKKEINYIKYEISELSLQVSSEQRKNFVNFYSQVVNLTKILQEHTAISEIFNFLEINILPEIAINSLDIKVSERTISLDGIAKSYEDLIGQMVIVEKSPLVEKANLESSQLSGNLVRFRVNLTFNSQVFSL